MAESAVSARPVRVLVLGQTPPPFGGQSLMIQAMLRGPMEGVELRHVRMAYSREMGDLRKDFDFNQRIDPEQPPKLILTVFPLPGPASKPPT